MALTLAKERPSVYLDLESREDCAQLADPELFLRNFQDRVMVLDEIHRMPHLFQSLRG